MNQEKPFSIIELCVNYFKQDKFNIFDFIEESITIGKFYDCLLSWINGKTFDYYMYKDMYFYHMYMIRSNHSDCYLTFTKHKKLMYFIILCYLKTHKSYNYEVSFKVLNRYDYEILDDKYKFLNILCMTRSMPIKCFDIWKEWT